MFSLPFIIVIAIITAALPAPISAFQLQLHHRVVHPSLPLAEPAFLKRADIISDAAGNPRIEHDSHWATFAETAHVTDALYQLALDPLPGQSTSSLISSVKACHLINAANEHIVLHVPHPGGTPFALEYFIDSVPSDGTCPPIKASGPNLASPHNVTVTISLPRRPPLPQLRVPPPLTATGAPVVPEPEKSFLQKYWIYIVILLGTLLIAPGAEEPPRGS